MIVSASSKRVEALGDRAQLDAVGGALRLEPSGTEPELEPPAGRHVDGHGHLRQHGRMAERDAGDEHAAAQAARACQQHGERAPPLERRLLRSGPQRVEVVVDPADLEDVQSIADVPQLGQLGPRAVRLRGGEGELRRSGRRHLSPRSN